MSGLPRPYFERDGIVLYCGDCREMIGALAFDVIVTDPPYGIRHASNYTSAWMNSEIAGDSDTSARDCVLHGRTEWACFGAITFPPFGARDILIWDKGPASGMGDLAWPWKRSWEPIYLSGIGWKGPRDEGVIKGCWIVTRASMGRTHPNEKPVSLLRYLIGRHDGVILDPFAGSGTTLVAALAEGRRAIGIEIEERYCEIAAKRLEQGVLPLERT